MNVGVRILVPSPIGPHSGPLLLIVCAYLMHLPRPHRSRTNCFEPTEQMQGPAHLLLDWSAASTRHASPVRGKASMGHLC